MKGKEWKEYKRCLPKNWSALVVENIKSKSINLTTKQVCQVRSGNIANPEWQLIVWEEIAKLKKATHRRRKTIQRFQSV